MSLLLLSLSIVLSFFLYMFCDFYTWVRCISVFVFTLLTMEKNKRVRSSNFTQNEKSTLLEIIHKYRNIVECKKTDATSNEEKTQAWHNIASEFNACAPSLQERSVESLKKFFDNKKKEVRKEISEEKKQMFLTGGGLPPLLKKDENQEILLSIMDKSTVYGTKNNYDSDSIETYYAGKKLHADSVKIYEVDNEGNCRSDTIGNKFNDEITDLIEPNEQASSLSQKRPYEETSENFNWKKYKPGDLKRPSVLQESNIEKPSTTKKTKYGCSRRRPATTVKALTTSEIAEKYDKLMDRRLLIADLQMQSLELDIKLKKKQLLEQENDD